MANFTKNMSIEEILKEMNKNGGNTETIHAGPCFLQFKLHEQLLSEQQKSHKDLVELTQRSQKENLNEMKRLVFVTWALVAATILLTFLK